MSKYLFLFTIGPVQSFISQARKTQDIYTGSFLLSHLIDSVMKELEDKVNNCELIFPHKDIKFKPNRFIAEIESDDIEKVGKGLKSFAVNMFKEISISILDNVTLDSSKPDGFNSQIKDFFQVNWVALPLKEDDYEVIYKKIESYLGSIKNIRVFEQLNRGRGEIGRKCSLCGERNVLFYKRTAKNKEPAYIQKGVIEIKGNELNPGEGLCAVCFTKRFCKTASFPSTAEIALMDKIPKDDLNKFKNKNLDPQLFFEENLTKDYFEKFGVKTPLEEVKKLRKEILDKNNIKSKNLSKYYALVMLDGDIMGKWLSGEFLEENEKANLKDFHKKASEKLGNYATEIKDIIGDPKGKVIYAGGDDVFTFVSVNHLFDVLIELRKEFPKFEEMGTKIKNNKGSTASAGVVIAHYKTPLSEVLKWARKMEHEAKESGGRDSFAIAVLKRSGEISKSILKWEFNNSSSIEILEDLIEFLRQEDFSNTFIKNLCFEFRQLISKEGKCRELAIFKTELKRLVGRSCMMKRKQNETKDELENRKKEAINNLSENLNTLYINNKSFDNFLSALSIAEFIERGGVI